MTNLTRAAIPLNILLIDDHPLFVDALSHMLSTLREHVTIEVAVDFTSALKTLEENASYDLVLLDLGLPDIEGFPAIEIIRERYPQLTVTVVSANEDPDLIKKAIFAGVQGYIPKSTRSKVIISAINLVLSGGVYIPKIALTPIDINQPPKDRHPTSSTGSSSTRTRFNNSDIEDLLTDRQITILSNLVEGLSNKQIARKLDIADGTVRVHMSTIYRVLGVENRTQAVVKAGKLGI